jgi:hypothetical protein
MTARLLNRSALARKQNDTNLGGMKNMKAILLSSVLGAVLSGGYFVKNPVEILIPVHPVRKDLADVLADVASREKIPIELLRAIARVESNLDDSNSVFRTEPHVVAKTTKADGQSYGVMQVMGYHAKKTCGLTSWAELVGERNIENNINCGVTVLKNCIAWARAKKQPKGKVELIRHSLNCYNGDGTGKYYSKVLIALGEEALTNG